MSVHNFDAFVLACERYVGRNENHMGIGPFEIMKSVEKASKVYSEQGTMWAKVKDTDGVSLSGWRPFNQNNLYNAAQIVHYIVHRRTVFQICLNDNQSLVRVDGAVECVGVEDLQVSRERF